MKKIRILNHILALCLAFVFICSSFSFASVSEIGETVEETGETVLEEACEEASSEIIEVTEESVPSEEETPETVSETSEMEIQEEESETSDVSEEVSETFEEESSSDLTDQATSEYEECEEDSFPMLLTVTAVGAPSDDIPYGDDEDYDDDGNDDDGDEDDEKQEPGGSVVLSKDFLSMYIGETCGHIDYVLNVDGNITWESTNPDVVYVDEYTGEITSLKEGFSVVVAHHSNGDFDFCKVYSGFYVGVDVSVYDDVSDWDYIKEIGIDFAILRAGFAAGDYGTDRRLYDHYEGASEAGLNIGAYFFAYFSTEEGASVEAIDTVENKLAGMDLSLGLFCDYEYESLEWLQDHYDEYSEEYYEKYGEYPDEDDIEEQVAGLVRAYLETASECTNGELPVGAYSYYSAFKWEYLNDLIDEYPLWIGYVARTTDSIYDDYDDGYGGVSSTLYNTNVTPSEFDNLLIHQYSFSEPASKFGGSIYSSTLDMNVISTQSAAATTFVTPIMKSAKNKGSYVEINWIKPLKADAITGYYVFRREGNSEWQMVGQAGADDTSYTDKTAGLDSGKNYYYTVQAYSELQGQVYKSKYDTEGTVCFTVGDANRDGKVSALDYVAVKKHIMGWDTITDPDMLLAADANEDGKISALDYVTIKNTIMR